MNFDSYSMRLLAVEDGDAFFDLIERNRPRLQAFFSGTVSRTKTPEDTKNYVAEIMDKIANKLYLPFLLLHDQTIPVGFLDIKNIDWNIPKGELGCFVDERSAGK